MSNINNLGSFSLGQFFPEENSPSMFGTRDSLQSKIDTLYAKFKSDHSSAIGQRLMNRLDSTYFRPSNMSSRYDNFDTLKSHLVERLDKQFNAPVLVDLVSNWEHPDDMFNSTFIRFEKPSKKEFSDTTKKHFKLANDVEEWITHLMSGGETLFKSAEGKVIAPQSQTLPEKIKIYDHKGEKSATITPRDVVVVGDKAFNFINDEVVTYIEVQLIKRELADETAVATKPKEEVPERKRKRVEIRLKDDPEVASKQKTQSQRLLDEETKAKRKLQNAKQAEENVNRLHDEKGFRA
jgi:hypothetical protein